MNAKDLPTLNACVEKLMAQIISKQDELRRREDSCGTYHDVAKMNKLRQEIKSLDRRLTRAERLQDEALSAPPQDAALIAPMQDQEPSDCPGF